MIAYERNILFEKRWGFAAVIIGFLVGFFSAYFCIIYHLVIFGFNIMYIVSPILAGVVETIIARRKYGRTTGAISALLTFIFINIYGWILPGTFVDPTKEPVTLSFLTIICIALMLQAAFPILINYILLVIVLGTLKKIIGFFLFLPARIQSKPSDMLQKEMVRETAPDEKFLDELTTPLLSIPSLEKGKIKSYKGLVTGSAIAEEKESTGRLSKFIQPIQLEDMNLDKARKDAITHMLANAESIGANNVIDVLIDYVTVGGLQGSAIIVTATGTAVIKESN